MDPGIGIMGTCKDRPPACSLLDQRKVTKGPDLDKAKLPLVRCVKGSKASCEGGTRLDFLANVKKAVRKRVQMVMWAG